MALSFSARVRLYTNTTPAQVRAGPCESVNMIPNTHLNAFDCLNRILCPSCSLKPQIFTWLTVLQLSTFNQRIIKIQHAKSMLIPHALAWCPVVFFDEPLQQTDAKQYHCVFTMVKFNVGLFSTESWVKQVQTPMLGQIIPENVYMTELRVRFI